MRCDSAQAATPAAGKTFGSGDGSLLALCGHQMDSVGAKGEAVGDRTDAFALGPFRLQGGSRARADESTFILSGAVDDCTQEPVGWGERKSLPI
jgi:hypothetical protein